MPSVWAHPFIVDTLARSGLACVLSLALAMLLAPWCIRWLKRSCGEQVKSGSAELDRLHRAKHGTPTMGGVLIVGCFLAALFVVGDRTNPLVLLVAATTVALCAVGCTDDWIKLRTARRGLCARTKLAAQAVIALSAASLLFLMYVHTGVPPKLHLPLAGSLDMGWWFVPWAALVVVGSSNAVNLTDGLDGLAGGCMLVAVLAMSLVSLVAGYEPWAPLLGMAPVSGAAEMAVAGAALAGVLAAFLWFNCHPAKIFMGDAGSLPLGGVLGLMAVIARQELLLVIVGGVFVAEALSVIVQVGWFRTTGRRVLRCAPLHHHFQFAGVAEKQIVARFWLAGGLCAASGLAITIAGANWSAKTSSSDRGPMAESPQTLPTGAGQEMPAPERTISMRSVSK